MSEFPSSTFQGVRVLRPTKVSIIDNLGGVFAFFSLFIINNLQEATRLPPKTPMIDGVLQLSSGKVDDGISLCPLNPPGNTALASSVSQFSAMCADPSQPRPAITGTAKTEDRRGDSGGRFDTRFCPNPNPIVRWGKVGLRERSDRVRILLIEWPSGSDRK